MSQSDRQAIPYRRRTIVAATINGTASAIVYPERKRFDAAAGESLNDVIAGAKSWIDAEMATRHNARRAPHIAAAVEYQEAFNEARLNESEIAMLTGHAAAPERRMTATQIAHEAGYTDYGVANLHYGKLARRVAEHLELTVPTREDGTPIWTFALADDDSSNSAPDSAEFVWRLHEEVAAALDALNLRAAPNKKPQP